MKKISFTILCILVFSARLYAANQTMSACTQVAFNTAYSNALAGDTIGFPAGLCEITWSGSTEIAKTNLTIQGQGIGTTILADVHFNVRGANANGLRITNIEFSGPTYGVLFDFQLNDGNRTESIRIDHNKFNDVYVVTNWGRAENGNSIVPYNCVVDNNIFAAGINSYTQNYVWGDCDATQDFPFSLGTLDGVYFEDNLVTDASGYMDHFIASRCGSRYVIRHNRFDVCAWDPIDAHDSNEGGGRSNALRGSWTTEIYENEFFYSLGTRRIIHLRGGQHVIWNNRLNLDQSNGGIKLTSYNVYYGDCTYSECTTGDKTCSDGRWCDLINATYLWNNKYNCSSEMEDCSGGSTVSSIDDANGTVVKDSDYFIEAMPGYTPLTYPHPLRSHTPTNPANLRVAGQ